MSKLIDITGRRFGRLTVIERAGSNKYGAKWKCECDCGNISVVLGAKLRNGHTKSCGCLVVEHIENVNKTYGMSDSRIHYIWGNMKGRCYNENDQAYDRYGGRGITVCDEWREDFTAFVDWAFANGYADNLTLDRRDNDGNYCPENCRWATYKTQANNRRNSRPLTFNGETKSLSEWCEEYGKKRDTVRYRIRHGWTFEEAFDIIPRQK